jgi:hypothetical protein
MLNGVTGPVVHKILIYISNYFSVQVGPDYNYREYWIYYSADRFFCGVFCFYTVAAFSLF